MRTLLVTVLLAALVAPSAARADVVGILSPIELSPTQTRSYEKSLSMKRHGMAASILGIIQLVVGSAAGLTSILPTRSCTGDVCRQSGSSGIGGFAAGATFTALGAISISAGIPMWIYGAREVDRAKLSLSANASGLTLRF